MVETLDIGLGVANDEGIAVESERKIMKVADAVFFIGGDEGDERHAAGSELGYFPYAPGTDLIRDVADAVFDKEHGQFRMEGEASGEGDAGDPAFWRVEDHGFIRHDRRGGLLISGAWRRPGVFPCGLWSGEEKGTAEVYPGIMAVKPGVAEEIASMREASDAHQSVEFRGDYRLDDGIAHAYGRVAAMDGILHGHSGTDGQSGGQYHCGGESTDHGF